MSSKAEEKLEQTGDSLPLLRVMTEALPPYPFIGGNQEHAVGPVRYPTENPGSFVLGSALLSRPEVSVADFSMSKGTKYPEHGHDVSKEFLLVYTGRILVKSRSGLACVHFQQKEVEVGAGGCVCFQKKQVHSVEALEDTRLVAITIPRDSGISE